MPNAARRGQALIMISFSLTFLFAAMGLAIDLGYAYYLKARCQTAADAAASAAAVYAENNGDSCSSLSCPVTYTCAGTYPPTTSLQAGCLYATSDGPPTFTATMVENNTSVNGAKPSIWIQATVSTTAPNFFLFGSGYHTASISAQATAGVSTSGSSACVIVLNATAPDALSMSGGGTMSLTKCGLSVASTGSPAVYVANGGNISATQVIINGTQSVAPGSHITPTPVTGTVTDPLANLPKPSWTVPCDSAHTDQWFYSGSSPTLNPGTYCGGITSSGANVTLNPGTYILVGDGLIVSNSGKLTGNGVTFFVTGVTTGSPPSDEVPGPVTFTGAGAINLSAPTSGTYKGILFFQDSGATYSTPNSITNASGGTMSGTFYFPTTAMTLAGGSGATLTEAFIVNTLNVSNASYLLQADTTKNGSITGLSSTSPSLLQ